MARRQKRDVISEEDSSLKEVVQAILTAAIDKQLQQEEDMVMDWMFQPDRSPNLVIEQMPNGKVRYIRATGVSEVAEA